MFKLTCFSFFLNAVDILTILLLRLIPVEVDRSSSESLSPVGNARKFALLQHKTYQFNTLITNDINIVV